jgi:hypothetical protein
VVEDADRVGGGLLERLVARAGGDAAELELRAPEREQERDRVVVARISVEDDRNAHARSMRSRPWGRATETPRRPLQEVCGSVDGYE